MNAAPYQRVCIVNVTIRNSPLVPVSIGQPLLNKSPHCVSTVTRDESESEPVQGTNKNMCVRQQQYEDPREVHKCCGTLRPRHCEQKYDMCERRRKNGSDGVEMHSIHVLMSDPFRVL